MKAVLISAKPQCCELIVSGEKTIEVRKTKPSIKTPFKCYIYMTATKERCRFWEYITAYQNSKGNIVDGSQKVIGEFVCDRIYEWAYNYNVGEYNIGGDSLCRTCLSYSEFENYGKGKTLYGWHISELKIYDKPKELSEFCINGDCDKCGWFENGKCYKQSEQSTYNNHRIKRPPQSWCYVEELKEKQK